MTDERWEYLMADDSLCLTTEEIEEGWHFCCEFDGLLVGPDMPNEYEICTCPKSPLGDHDDHTQTSE